LTNKGAVGKPEAVRIRQKGQGTVGGEFAVVYQQATCSTWFLPSQRKRTRESEGQSISIWPVIQMIWTD
jgi:hypothetical protein